MPLLNNVMLTSAAAMVLLATLFPLLADAFHRGKTPVGPPYLGTLFLSPCLPYLICPLDIALAQPLWLGCALVLAHAVLI